MMSVLVVCVDVRLLLGRWIILCEIFVCFVLRIYG